MDLARPAGQDLYLTQLPSYEYRDLVAVTCNRSIAYDFCGHLAELFPCFFSSYLPSSSTRLPSHDETGRWRDRLNGDRSIVALPETLDGSSTDLRRSEKISLFR